MSRYTQRKDGEGFTIPNRTPYKLACCDCGLVHRIVIAAPGLKKGAEIGFAAKRDNRATAARRRKLICIDGRRFATELDAAKHLLWLIQRLCRYVPDDRIGEPCDGPRFREAIVETRKLLKMMGHEP